MLLHNVNIKMGTDSRMRYSHGNTLPLTQRPFGMASFCPQTERIKGEQGWFYNPTAPYCEGVRLTHQPSPWIGDYGTVLMTPQIGIPVSTAEQANSSFRKNEAVLNPHYIKLKLLKSRCVLELTPTERGASINLNFEDPRRAYLSFLPVEGEYTYCIDEKSGAIFGTSNAQPRGTAKNFKMYFAVKVADNNIDYEKTEIGNGYIHIALKNKTAQVMMGISYISHQMALCALEREVANKSFNELVREGEEEWEEKLSRIEIESCDQEQIRTFYSCLYRCFLFPRKAYEIESDGRAVHYCPVDGGVREGVMYTDTGFWDTSRTLFPLFSLIAREEYAQMLCAFVNIYEESGYLPRWHSIDEVGCMPSTLIDSVILDAAYNGIGTRELLEKALDGMIHHANVKSKEARFGRNGVEEYLKYGYVPCDLYKENVNLTLDAAYGDWCIAQLSKMLGRDSIYDEYMARSKNYRNLFDKETGFMRGKDTLGGFRDGFNKFTWGIDYTEGGAYQSSHFVPHDIEGLCELYGTKDNLIAKIDEIFETPPYFYTDGYGCEIHEMSEMAQADLGQCAISNQPSFHIPYLYAYLGRREKAQYWIEKICKEMFFANEQGYPGDEDNGSMSAWYVLSTLGMYPLCAGKEMVKIKPLVRGAKVNGNKIF